MTLNEYQKQSYIAIQDHESNKEEVMHWAIGLGEEAGEALSVIKHKYYGGEYDIEDLVGELGDLLWYVAALATASGIGLEDVAQYNLAKVHFRHQGDNFNIERNKRRHELDKAFRQEDSVLKIMQKIKKEAKR